MLLIVGYLVGSLLTGAICYLLMKPQALGTVFLIEDDSMYIEMDDENSLDIMKSKPYAVFRLKHRSSPK